MYVIENIRSKFCLVKTIQTARFLIYSKKNFYPYLLMLQQEEQYEKI